MTAVHPRLPASGLLLVLALPSVSLAQSVTIVYEPAVAAVAATSVPSLSEWGLMALAAVMAFAAYRALRRGTGARLWSLAVLAAASLVVTQWIARPAMAVPAGVSMSSAAGGSVTANGTGEHSVSNTSGVALKIRSVDYENGTPRTPAGEPPCVSGLVVNAGQQCFVRIFNPL